MAEPLARSRRCALALLAALVACSARPDEPAGAAGSGGAPVEPPPAGAGGEGGSPNPALDPTILSVPPKGPGALAGDCTREGGCQAGTLCSTGGVCLPLVSVLPARVVRAAPSPGQGHVPTSMPVLFFLDGAYPALDVQVRAWLDDGIVDVTSGVSVTRLSTASGNDLYVLAPTQGFPLAAAIEVRLSGPFHARLVFATLSSRPGPSPSTLGFEIPQLPGGAAGASGAAGSAGEAGSAGDAGSAGEAGAAGDAGQAGAAGESASGGASGEASGEAGQGGFVDGCGPAGASAQGGSAGQAGAEGGGAAGEGAGGQGGSGGPGGGAAGDGAQGEGGGAGGPGCAAGQGGTGGGPGEELRAGWGGLGDVGVILDRAGDLWPAEGRRFAALSTGAVVRGEAASGVVSALVSGPMDLPDGGEIGYAYRFVSSEFDEFCGSPHDDALVAVAMGPRGAEARLLASVNLLCGDQARVPVSFPGLPDQGDPVCLGTGWRSGEFGAALGSPVRLAFVLVDVADQRLTSLAAFDAVRVRP